MPIASTKDMCYYVFNVLYQHLLNNQGISLDSTILNIEVPLFVTYKTLNNQLRGCIGNLSPINLQQNLPKYALISALQDPRFSPITIKDLPNLKVQVSLLINYEKCSIYDWVIGQHGIIIQFDHYQGTFLPEVAQEQEWSQMTTIEQLIRKSGYRGKINQELLDSVNCERYQSSISEITFEQFQNKTI